PEEVLVPWAAMRLGRPVKWTEDRRENFTATTQERGQVHDAELAVAKDGKILGVKDVFLHDSGAYDSYGLTVPINSQCTLLGPYDVPNYYTEFTAVFTNKTLVTPVRGAGRQHGVFVMERLLDFAARALGLDRLEIRRRNYLPPGAFPFNNEIIFQDSAPLVYDSGDYAPALEDAARMIGYEKFVREEQPRLRVAGRHVGVGVVSYIEGTGIGPYEGARVTIEPSGRVRVATGANPLRGAVKPGTEPGLEATAYYGPDRGSTASGVHAMIVEVDPETAMVEIQRYVVVHDCGKLINPMIVEGQIQGGVAHGIGNAFYEQLVYDDTGQLQNASFMDYLLPTATDVPRVEIAHRETPSPLNPIGLKGVGEAGCIPTGAAFAQAVEDALADFGVEITEIPLSPDKLFDLLKKTRPKKRNV